MRATVLAGFAVAALSSVLVGCPKKNKPPPVAELFMGEHVTCARLDDGELRCQGRNTDGELGPLATGHGPAKMPVTGPLLAVRIHPRAVCLVPSGADTTCFGVAEPPPNGAPICTLVEGKLGCDEKRLPVPPDLASLGRVVEVASGRAHVCVRFAEKTVSCFGDNGSYQLAAPLPAVAKAPLPIQGVFGAEQIVAAGDGTCARLGDKTVRCWGKNDDERLSVGRGEVLNVPAPVHF